VSMPSQLMTLCLHRIFTLINPRSISLADFIAEFGAIEEEDEEDMSEDEGEAKPSAFQLLLSLRADVSRYVIFLNSRLERRYIKLNKQRKPEDVWNIISNTCMDPCFIDSMKQNLIRESRKLLAAANHHFMTVVTCHNNLFGSSGRHGTKYASILRVRKRESMNALEKVIFKYNAIANEANDLQPGLMM
jgi:hypothetical protein